MSRLRKFNTEFIIPENRLLTWPELIENIPGDFSIDWFARTTAPGDIANTDSVCLMREESVLNINVFPNKTRNDNASYSLFLICVQEQQGLCFAKEVESVFIADGWEQVGKPISYYE